MALQLNDVPLQTPNLPQNIIQAMQAWRDAQQTGLKNQILQAQVPLAGQMAQTSLNQQIGKQYTDPILQRFYQMGLAQQTGQIPQEYLNRLQPNNQIAMGNPAMTQSGDNSTTNNIPGFSNDPLTNWAYTDNPYGYQGQIALQGAKTQAEEQGKTNVSQWNDAQKEVNENAQDANDMLNYLNGFKENYDKSKFTGPILGKVETSGPSSLPGYLLGHDFSNERQADTMAKNMQAQMTKLMHFNKLTNYELNFTGGLKLDRTMPPQAVNNLYNFFKAKSNQLGEQQGFYNNAKGLGLSKPQADVLWQMYINQRPAYDFSRGKPNTQFNGTSKEFLTPEAINAVKTGQDYVPMPQFKNSDDFKAWASSLNPHDQMIVDQMVRGGK